MYKRTRDNLVLFLCSKKKGGVYMTQKARAFRDIREVDGKYYAVDSRFSELSGYETMVFPCSSFRKELDFKRGFCLRKSPDERTMKWQHEEILRNIASYVRKGE